MDRNWISNAVRPLLVGVLVGGLLAGCATPPPVICPATEQVAWGTAGDEARSSYDRALDLLARGRQADAETVVSDACAAHMDSQRILFLGGVLSRSRFMQEQARGAFAEAYRLDKHSVLGHAANIVITMDLGVNVETGFKRLGELIEQYPDEVLLRWLYVTETIGCSPHVQDGLSQCEAILQQWKVGPVTFHKAYANLLTAGQENPEKALEHRQLAAELEPSAKTYEGLARTLEIYQRYAEAEPVYAKMTELEPDSALRWFQWGNCLAYLGDFSAAAEKFEKAQTLDDSEAISLLCLGRCLERLGRPEDGYTLYAAAFKARPFDQQAAAYVAHAKLYGYGTACDFEGALVASANPNKPAIKALAERVRLANSTDNPLAPERSAVLMKHLTAQAEGGDAEAEYSLGMIYTHGIGVAKDPQAAAKWLQRAAGHGHAIAQRVLNPPLVGRASVVAFDVAEAIQGVWKSDQSSVVYEIGLVDGTMTVKGRSGISGRELMIGDVSWDGTVLHYTSYMPATDFRIVHENRLVDEETMTSTTTGADAHTVTWKKEKQASAASGH